MQANVGRKVCCLMRFGKFSDTDSASSLCCTCPRCSPRAPLCPPSCRRPRCMRSRRATREPKATDEHRVAQATVNCVAVYEERVAAPTNAQTQMSPPADATVAKERHEGAPLNRRLPDLPQAHAHVREAPQPAASADSARLIPLKYINYSVTLLQYVSRGTGRRSRQLVDPEVNRYEVNVTRALLTHNHRVDKETYQQYSNARLGLSDELLSCVELMHKTSVKPKEIRSYIIENSSCTPTFKDRPKPACCRTEHPRETLREYRLATAAAANKDPPEPVEPTTQFKVAHAVGKAVATMLAGIPATEFAGAFCVMEVATNIVRERRAEAAAKLAAASEEVESETTTDDDASLSVASAGVPSVDDPGPKSLGGWNVFDKDTSRQGRDQRQTQDLEAQLLTRRPFNNLEIPSTQHRLHRKCGCNDQSSATTRRSWREAGAVHPSGAGPPSSASNHGRALAISHIVEWHVERVKKLKIGPPHEEGANLGPLIGPEDAVTNGATALVGGQRRDIGRNFYEATVLAHFTTEEEVIEMANSTEAGRAGYFTRRTCRERGVWLLRWTARASVSSVFCFNCTCILSKAPFQRAAIPTDRLALGFTFRAMQVLDRVARRRKPHRTSVYDEEAQPRAADKTLPKILPRSSSEDALPSRRQESRRFSMDHKVTTYYTRRECQRQDGQSAPEDMFERKEEAPSNIVIKVAELLDTERMQYGNDAFSFDNVGQNSVVIAPAEVYTDQMVSYGRFTGQTQLKKCCLKRIFGETRLGYSLGRLSIFSTFLVNRQPSKSKVRVKIGDVGTFGFEHNAEVTLVVSFLEIYCDRVRDLTRAFLELRVPQGIASINIVGATVKPLTQPREFVLSAASARILRESKRTTTTKKACSTNTTNSKYSDYTVTGCLDYVLQQTLRSMRMLKRRSL
ncbi:hypothetical protein PHYSODRAFT_308209 [Phytophthora sojae]|uniref:Uncharacterized protein n=1 Tax=Phytophthora sojae (strain P6497) TaxID=1094619 RepID=G5AIT6_PHYSP|nr:hypothetical protein PHYSODRAFT_308209 [Phytophthora sojae]EGZ04549.1 hypothetical protein PHYSODRAFT_308209 [Phytophthora sojae]|eukprot:XP_009539987.1 hypothetical protein PHYSODRAFT_308209 [Phytophthora sojae]